MSPHLALCEPGDRSGAEPAEQFLCLAGGEAFNPTHSTTRLCLELIGEALAGASVRSFLDVGCGSGVLGLAAAALGVPRVVAVDLAREAARVTRENARHNGLAARVLAVQGSTECLKGPFDLVAANLHWEVQLGKVAEFHRLAAAGGGLILSGFRDHQEPRLLPAYRRLGWRLQRRRVKGFSHPELPRGMSFNWTAWLLTRPKGEAG